MSLELSSREPDSQEELAGPAEESEQKPARDRPVEAGGPGEPPSGGFDQPAESIGRKASPSERRQARKPSSNPGEGGDPERDPGEPEEKESEEEGSPFRSAELPEAAPVFFGALPFVQTDQLSSPLRSVARTRRIGRLGVAHAQGLGLRTQKSS